jgi:hypothetical protein
MKAIITVAALIAAIASPAFAQTAQQSGNTAISGNQNLGSDPDANVRLDLMRESGSRTGGF